MVTISLSDEEAVYLSDILQMWVEGIEEELPALIGASPDVHWSKFQLRKQFAAAGAIKLRLNLEGM